MKCFIFIVFFLSFLTSINADEVYIDEVRYVSLNSTSNNNYEDGQSHAQSLRSRLEIRGVNAANNKSITTFLATHRDRSINLAAEEKLNTCEKYAVIAMSKPDRYALKIQYFTPANDDKVYVYAVENSNLRGLLIDSPEYYNSSLYIENTCALVSKNHGGYIYTKHPEQK